VYESPGFVGGDQIMPVMCGWPWSGAGRALQLYQGSRPHEKRLFLGDKISVSDL
jgi:hypothetical protein